MKKRILLISLFLLPILLMAQPPEYIDAYNLKQAIVAKDVDKVKAMINEGKDVNYQVDGRNALHTACDKGLVEMAELVIDAGADVNAYSEEGAGRTPLQFVAGDIMQDFSELIELLMKNGADPNLSLDPDQLALFEAIGHAHVESVKVLLEHGAGTEVKNSMDLSPGEYVSYLINRGKNDKIPDWKKIQVILSKK